jgi:uncharacterized membrane protein
VRRGSTDLMAAIAVTLVAMAATLAPGTPAPVRLILGALLVLILPGYAVSAACLPFRSVGVPERLCLTLGLSVGIMIVGGLLLNWAAPALGLHRATWSILLGDVTLTACGIALERRFAARARRLKAEQMSITLPHVGRLLRSGLLLAITLLALAAAITISVSAAVNQERGQQSTELWMLPASLSGQEQAFQVDISNLQSTTTSYHLEVLVEGRPFRRWESIRLKPYGTWRATWTLTHSQHAHAMPVQAVLYLQSASSTPYRRAELWLGPST